MSLLIRNNGTNPPTSDQFKTYAGGPLAGAWQPTNMTLRVTPDSSGYTPQYMADYYYSKVSGISNSFVDYYVSATDAHGNTYKSPIQHVYVGMGSGGGGGTGTSGPVSLSPTNPVAGNSVTIQYVATGRNIASANPVYLHLGWNNWNPVVSPDVAMTFNSASNWWQYTAAIPSTATNLNCVFNNGSGTWDNNGGANWNFAVTANSNPQPPSTPQNLTTTPVATNQINLAWSAASGASLYFVNRDSAMIGTTANISFSDTGLGANSSHCYSVIASNSLGASAASVTVCANTLAPVTNLPAFTLDGAFDYPGYQLASSGMVLYGAVRGTTLYVATWSPGTNGPNDHFIFVTDQLLSAGAAAPWAKAGTAAIATTKPFLAAESQGAYASWFVNNSATNWPCSKSYTNSGALAGTLDLIGAFGYMPTNLYLCAAAYQTTNGGALAAQCPAAVTVNGNIETNEFLILPLAALRDSLGNGTLDLCDPARGFRIFSAAPQGTNRVLNFAVMPGRNYLVQYATSLGGGWTNLPFTNFALPPQLNLNFTDSPPAGAPQRFYRVQLLP